MIVDVHLVIHGEVSNIAQSSLHLKPLDTPSITIKFKQLYLKINFNQKLFTTATYDDDCHARQTKFLWHGVGGMTLNCNIIGDQSQG